MATRYNIPWQVATNILDRRTWIMYLQIRDGLRAEWERAVVIEPDGAFYARTQEIVHAYLEKGKVPPAEIAVPILNIADDVAGGRDVTIRAGDYIALQTYMKEHPAKA